MKKKISGKRVRGIKPKRNKWCRRKFLSTRWPMPRSAPSSDQPLLANLPQFMHWTLVLWYGTSHWAALLPMLTLGFVCNSSWAEHWTLKSPWVSEHCWAAAKTSVCIQHYPQTRSKTQHCARNWEEINSISAKSRRRGFNINSNAISASSQREKKKTKSHLC